MIQEFDRRPLLLTAIGLVAGLVAIRHPGALLVPFVLLAATRINVTRAWICGGLVVGLLLAPQPAKLLETRKFVDAEAIVATTPKLYPDRVTAQVEVQGLRLLMRSPADTRLAMGEQVRLMGVARPLSEASAKYLAVQGVQGRIDPVRAEVFRRGPWLTEVSESVRRSFLIFTRQTMPEHIAAATDAMCFNVDTRLGEEEREGLVRTGTVHIVSASGLHVVVLASALLAVLGLMPIPRPPKILLLAAMLAVYACATGLHGPMVRASLVSLAALSAYMVRRDPDALSALALAAIAYLLWKPHEVYQPGFQLSFVTVAAFCLFLPRDTVEGVTPKALGWLRAAFVASVATAPLVAYHFGTLPLLTIPANALIAFVVPPIVVISLMAFSLSPFWFALAQGLMLAVTPLVAWLLGVVRLLSELPWSVLHVPEFSGYWLVPVYGAAVLLWRRHETPAVP